MVEAPKRGRPRRGDAAATERVHARLSPAEKAYLEERAAAADLDLAEYLRRAAFAYDAAADDR